VYFNLTPTIIYEPLDVVDELKQYRRNNEIQRRADKERIERILSYKIYVKMTMNS
jgi:hypothetical protein